MKTIGLIGGTSPESTTDYYLKINRFVNEVLCKHHSAKIVMVSVEFEEIVSAIVSSRWDIVSQIMTEAALTLQAAGVDILALCSNTLHKVYPELKACLNIPILHILDPVINVIQQNKINKIAVLGTIYTMQGDFYPAYFKQNCNVELIMPSYSEMMIINDFIFDCLCKGHWDEKRSAEILKIVNGLVKKHVADAVLLACTELSYFFEEAGLSANIIDTTYLHSKALRDFICSDLKEKIL